PATRRVAPKMAWGFVARRSQIAADMLPRRASPQAILGATKHQPIARHHTRVLLPAIVGLNQNCRQRHRLGVSNTKREKPIRLCFKAHIAKDKTMKSNKAEK